MIVCRFVPTADDDRYAYWRTLSRAWIEPDPIVNIEHDMERSLSLVDELLACPYPLCSHAYRMWVPREYWAHSHSPDGIGGQWVAEGEEWAAWSAIGFCKIAPEARPRQLARIDWPGVESSVNHAVNGPWHLHWPAISHFHTREGQRIFR